MSSYTLKSLIIFGLWIGLFSPVFFNLWNDWLNHSNNSHGFLVPFISLYFVCQKKDELQTITISTSIWGAGILIISLLIYLLAFAGDVAFIARIMMVVSLMGLVLFNYGKQNFKQILFPLFFLFFMIPIPVSLIQTISMPLQLLATTISARIIKILSIPVNQEGNMLYFAQTQLEVAQACSGLRSIMALTMLSVIFVYLSRKGIVGKIILLASAIPIALLANIIRVTGTGILAHFYGSVVARGFLHEFSGLIVFVFGFLVLSLEFSLLNKIGTKKA